MLRNLLPLLGRHPATRAFRPSGLMPPLRLLAVLRHSVLVRDGDPRAQNRALATSVGRSSPFDLLLCSDLMLRGKFGQLFI